MLLAIQKVATEPKVPEGHFVGLRPLRPVDAPSEWYHDPHIEDCYRETVCEKLILNKIAPPPCW